VGRAKFATLADLVAAIPSLVADRDEEAIIAARHAERLAVNKAAELVAKLAQDELNALINAKIKTGEYTHNFTHMYGTGKVFSGDVLIATSSAIRATQQWSSKDAWGTGHDEPSPIIGYHYTLCDPQ
jgi:ssDNA-binding replication factor A large subunit